MTVWPEQRAPITWEMFLDIDEEHRRDLEIVDGYVVPREQRSREHQKVGTRLSMALERCAVEQIRRTGRAECYETNTEVDVLLWEVPPTARKPDAVLHRCIPEYEQLAAEHVLVVAEVLSKWSERRDRVHKMSDYADAGIPHYWLIGFDKIGALTIDRYALHQRSRSPGFQLAPTPCPRGDHHWTRCELGSAPGGTHRLGRPRRWWDRQGRRRALEERPYRGKRKPA